uniref:Uncharacterized protein n=1 Tax=Amphilophus citrinellus TaxID=61819 RepID=A0A3Q0RHF5_AMPCI
MVESSRPVHSSCAQQETRLIVLVELLVEYFELDVVVAVIFCHLLCSSFVVSHPDTMRFHGMPLSIVIISYVTCKDKRISKHFSCRKVTRCTKPGLWLQL